MLGGYNVSRMLLEDMFNTVKDGVCLELGSGAGTDELAKVYEVYSVEHDFKFVNKHRSYYIYAPIVHGWYDTTVLRHKVPKIYDILLIDGPTGSIGRLPFIDNLDLFHLDCPIFVDDVHRKDELNLATMLSEKLGRKMRISKDDKYGRKYAVILLN